MVFAALKRRSTLRQERHRQVEVSLFVACSETPPDLETVQALISEYPAATKALNGDGAVPLHVALSHGASLEVVQYMVRKDAESVLQRDHLRWCPLHCAVAHQEADLEVVKFLTKEWPHANSQGTIEGQVPLHLACGNQASMEVVQYVSYFLFSPRRSAIRRDATANVTNSLSSSLFPLPSTGT